MRDIKFRAWHKQAKAFISWELVLRMLDGEIVYINHSPTVNVCFKPEIRLEDIATYSCRGNPFHDKDVYEMVMYTGIKDVSEKPVNICANDVIESFDSQGYSIRHHIVWSNEDSGFVAEFIPYNKFNPHCTLRQSWITEFGKKVIGNSLKNPELLEK